MQSPLGRGCGGSAPSPRAFTASSNRSNDRASAARANLGDFNDWSFLDTARPDLALGSALPPASPPADTSKDVALKAQATQYSADIKAKNIDKVIAYYADDAVYMQTGVPVASDADQEGMQASPRRSGLRTRRHRRHGLGGLLGDWASVVGHADTTATNPNTHGIGFTTQNYVVTEKKDGGTWKVEAVAIAVPPPAAAPAPAAPAKS